MSKFPSRQSTETAEEWVLRMATQKASIDVLDENHRLLNDGYRSYPRGNTTFGTTNLYVFPLLRVKIQLSDAANKIQLRAANLLQTPIVSAVDDGNEIWTTHTSIGDIDLRDINGSRQINSAWISRRLVAFLGNVTTDPNDDTTAKTRLRGNPPPPNSFDTLTNLITNSGFRFGNSFGAHENEIVYDAPGITNVITYEYQWVLNIPAYASLTLTDYIANSRSESVYNQFIAAINDNLKITVASANKRTFLSAQEILDATPA